MFPDQFRVVARPDEAETAGAAENVSERVVAATGFSYTDSAEGYIKGAKPYENEQASPNPYVEEHRDLIASIKAGKPLNEGRQVAESCLTAIDERLEARPHAASRGVEGVAAARSPEPEQDAPRLEHPRKPRGLRRRNVAG